MKEYELEFCFKGSRKYVHGTDIFNKLLDTLKDDMTDNNLDLSFHGISIKNIYLSEMKPNNEELLKFAFRYKNKNDEKNILYGIENNKDIECRYEYKEEDICLLSEINIEEEEICLEEDSSYSFVENSVAINKFLLENLFPNANGKWYFTRLQLTTLPEKAFPLKLKLKANFNFKLTKTEIYISDILVGYIYFSLV